MGHRKVAVVGAGIVGISSALQILKKYPNVEVVIFSDKFSPDTTGDGAAGFWTPIYLNNTPTSQALHWCKVTYDYLAEMAITEEGPKAGVFFQLTYQISKEPNMTIPFFHSIPISFNPMDAKELSMFPNARSGYSYITLMAQGTFIMEYLQKQLIEAGGKLVHRHVTNLDDLSSEGFHVVVNCSGLGARNLVNDANMHPIRGQIHKVAAPWQKFVVVDETSYIIPVMDQVVFGGTNQKQNWSTEVNRLDEERIFKSCSTLLPSLTHVKRLNDWVGLRPGRTELRLEKEICINQNNGNKYTVVHNYGHGGSGLTFFWGTAQDTLDLLENDLQNKPMAKL